jgi:hypothetical protein
MPITPPGGSPSGWGSEPWGSGGWGGPVEFTFSIVSAIAIAENVIQLVFNDAVYYSGLLDTADASVASHYTVTNEPTTTGYDGNPAQPVNAVSIMQSSTDIPAGIEFGAALDVILDRPLSPYPTTYTIAIAGLFNASLTQEIAPTTLTFYGLYRQLVQPSVELAAPARDFANPSSLLTAVGLPNSLNPAVLGVFSVDSSGDYAIDQGLADYKKRVYRRLVTRPGGFLHLGRSYGVGVPQQTKRLARGQTIQNLATQAQNQIGQEPETEACSVTATQDSTNPGLVRFTILARTKGGQASKFSAAFGPQ